MKRQTDRASGCCAYLTVIRRPFHCYHVAIKGHSMGKQEIQTYFFVGKVWYISGEVFIGSRADIGCRLWGCTDGWKGWRGFTCDTLNSLHCSRGTTLISNVQKFPIFWTCRISRYSNPALWPALLQIMPYCHLPEGNYYEPLTFHQISNKSICRSQPNRVSCLFTYNTSYIQFAWLPFFATSSQYNTDTMSNALTNPSRQIKLHFSLINVSASLLLEISTHKSTLKSLYRKGSAFLCTPFLTAYSHIYRLF